MSFFRYEAVDRAGKIVMGTMDAPSEAVVSARLSQMGYQAQKVIAAQSAAAAKAANRTGSQPALPNAQSLPPTAASGTATPKELSLFYRQFAALVRSGITLFSALENLGPRTPNLALSQTTREMAEAARRGGRISDVMEKYPRLYAPHVVASVRAAEKGGFIEIVLDEVALEYEQEIAFYKGMAIARWSIIQGLIAIAVAQPVFPHLFTERNVVLYLQLVFLRNIPILLALVGAGKLYLWWLQQPPQRERRDALMLRLPVFGDLARQRSLAAFIRMLRRLFAAGIGPINAWEGAMNVAPNAIIRNRLNEAYGIMQQNVPLHEAFAQTGLFANEAEQLLATGVVSGAMVDMLDRVAEYYQANVDRAFENSRYTMKRIAGVTVIVLVGVLLIVFVNNYFASVFEYGDKIAE